MTPRENLISLYNRTGYEYAPVYFVLCPSLITEFEKRYGNTVSYRDFFNFPVKLISDPGFSWDEVRPGFVPEREFEWDKYYTEPLHPKARVDIWGIAHEPGSKDCVHMTLMRHPLENLQTLKELEEYPWPDFYQSDFSVFKPEIEGAHANGYAAHVWMECTIWEVAWYLRRMEILMTEMMMEDEKAYFLFDKITELACHRAREFAKLGIDILALGDDIGMQSSTIMDHDLYRAWIKPRLTKVIEAAKSVNPDIIIQYHSCGFAKPFIPDLIEAGIDVLNPVQPEACMDFGEIHREYGNHLSFNGTLGTQTTMPFATPKQVKELTTKNLGIAGKKGGLLCCPTHMLEPEVPWENIEAYMEACREFKV
ncbi:MAG: hypothetical protein A2W90_21460 [Bacteroidetes bacterium GWF2_42_66]|nr:MAG: hypothetical protein A2W92_04275 [Bacteroidetes bacterium GWA2_42_15]OFX98902.1 MAG: hypothetical protein A2W89_13095 [Bacteroidetes bacterium GWE2_42_39]OFY45617.1 MAG: hypothetical protein A2W90_21460 [Bacteroidetes bacterium GWF2_42_66]HBL77403.1 hypothetical protein [Prolixibacteraceae bacterium]HCU62433.1 hypothetical protein [Prolixibacteraceae bacterium]